MKDWGLTEKTRKQGDQREMSEALMALLDEHLYRFALIIALCMAAMVVAMAIDLIFGVRKAKENGEATTSCGFKKTCDKARKYFSPFIVTVCIDIIACVVVSVPIFSMIWAAYCIFCEFISVREKAWKKAEIRKQERTMQVVLENKEDIAKALMAALREMQKQGKEEDDGGK